MGYIILLCSLILLVCGSIVPSWENPFFQLTIRLAPIQARKNM